MIGFQLRTQRTWLHAPSRLAALSLARLSAVGAAAAPTRHQLRLEKPGQSATRARRIRGRWHYLALPIYALLVALLVPRHEPWFDEAQGWLLARDNSFSSLFGKWIEYEGSPGLWHLILMAPSHAHLPYITENWIAAAANVAAVAVLLRYSPFPRWLKFLLPFTYFLFYQYAVIARNYSLLPLLLFAAAAAFPRWNQARPPRVLLFTVVLALLANLTVHALLIAISLYAVHLLNAAKRWGRPDGPNLRHYLLSGAIFLLAVLAAAYQIRIPADFSVGGVAPGWNLSRKHAELITGTMLDGALTDHPLLSYAALTASAVWFWRTRVLLLFALPMLGIFAIFVLKYAALWHQGIVFLVWVTAFWFSFENRHLLRREERWLQVLAYGPLLTVLFFQLQWSFHSYVYDFSRPYSADSAVASYVKECKCEGQGIYATSFHSIGILPYFDRNIFRNYNHGDQPSFWQWVVKPPVESPEPAKLAADQPELIIIGIKQPAEAPPPDVPTPAGYERVGYFQGDIYWKDHAFETDSFVVFRRKSQPRSAAHADTSGK